MLEVEALSGLYTHRLAQACNWHANGWQGAPRQSARRGTFAVLLQSARLLFFHAKSCCATAHWIAAPVHQPVAVSVPQATCLVTVVKSQYSSNRQRI